MLNNSFQFALFCVMFILICPIDEQVTSGSWTVLGDQNSDPGNDQDFGSVQQIGGLLTGRYNHTATLLGDGRVLAVGGTADGRMSLDSTEFYDPVTGEWNEAPVMSSSRMRHTATLLDSGKVLIVGGYTGKGSGSPSLRKHFNGTGNISLSSCEIYDPLNDTLSPGASLLTGRFWHRAVKLKDGRILVMGGLNVSTGALSSCEIFDPEIEAWKEVSPLRMPKVRFTATVLENGSVLITGGHDGITKEPFPWCEIYVPENDTWYDVASMNRARGYHTGIILDDGKVLVSGGFSAAGEQDWNDSEIYDPELDVWLEAGSMSLPRHNHVMIEIEMGEILMFGGSNCLTGEGHSGIEYYDPDLEVWDHTNLVILGLKWTAAVLLQNGNVLICGGKACNDPSNVSYMYIPPEIFEEKEGSNNVLRGFEDIPAVIGVFVIISILMDRYEAKDSREKRMKAKSMIDDDNIGKRVSFFIRVNTCLWDRGENDK